MGGLKDFLIELTCGVADELGITRDATWDRLEEWIMDNIDGEDIALKVSPVVIARRWRKAHYGKGK